MKLAEATTLATQTATRLGAAGVNDAWGGKTWWVFSSVTDSPDMPFIIVTEEGEQYLEQIPIGRWFDDLTPVDSTLTSAAHQSIEIPGVDRDQLEERADQFAEQVVRLLGQTARKMSHQIGGVLIAAARDPLKAAAVSVDDIAGITDVWHEGTLTMLVPAIQEEYAGSRREQAEHAADALQTVTQPILEDETAVRYMAGARNRLVRVGDELWQNARTNLAEGLAQGESISQLSQRVRDAASVTAPRATVIARTEVLGASNFGSISAMRALGVEGMMKIWISTKDARTRPSHRALNGKTVKLEGTFMVGGWPGDRPHDPMLPVDETANCRCTLGYDLPSPAPALEPGQLSQVLANHDENGLNQVMNDFAARTSQKLPDGIDVKVLGAVAGDNFSGVTFGLHNAAGQRIGMAHRRFNIDTHDRLVGDEIRRAALWVEHDTFDIDPAYQGRGIATAFNRELEELYRANGVKYITVHANEDVGGYAWARAGYDWDRAKTTPSKVTGLLQEIKFEDEALIPQVDAMFDRMDDHDMETWPTPFDISQLGWKPGLETWAGKEALLGSDWNGIKWLT